MPVVGTFLSNTFLAILAFSIVNRRTAAVGMSGWLYISILAFSFIKIVMWGQQQVYQQ